MPSEAWPARVVQIGFGLVLFALTLEVAARLAFATPAFDAAIQGQTAAGRRASWVTRAQSTPSTAFFRYPFVRHDTARGWRTQPSAPEGPPKTTLLADGTRDVGPATAPSPRWAAVGDSFTFGLDVRDEDAWLYRLQAGITGDIQNHGVPGYGLDQAWLAATQDVLGADAPPDVLLLGINELMVLRSARWWDAWAKPWLRLDDAGAITVHGTPVVSPAQARPTLLRPRAVDVAAIWWERLGGSHQADGPTDDPYGLARAILDDLAARSEAMGVRVVLIHLLPPSNPAFSLDHLPEADFTTAYRSICEDLAGRVLCIDTAKAFATVPDAERAAMVLDAHWSPSGHRLVADAVRAALVDAGLATTQP